MFLKFCLKFSHHTERGLLNFFAKLRASVQKFILQEISHEQSNTLGNEITPSKHIVTKQKFSSKIQQNCQWGSWKSFSKTRSFGAFTQRLRHFRFRFTTEKIRRKAREKAKNEAFWCPMQNENGRSRNTESKFKGKAIYFRLTAMLHLNRGWTKRN